MDGVSGGPVLGVIPLDGEGDAGPRFVGLPGPLGGPRLTPPVPLARARDRVVIPTGIWVFGP